MKFKMAPRTTDWWFWALTLLAMIAGLAGLRVGFMAVMLVSAVQVVYFWGQRGFFAFPTQVREAYFALTVIAYFDPTLLLYWSLLVGTVMVTFFDRCVIARVLVHMPWNKGVKLT